MDTKYDSVLFEILREKKYIARFLDSLFGFLYRCTDFYILSAPNQCSGYPPGVAEQLVVSTLRKWQNIKSLSESHMQVEVPPTVMEIVVTSDDNIKSKPNLDSRDENSEKVCKSEVVNEKIVKKSSNCYNGASYDNYDWSQSIREVDVLVRIPKEVISSKEVRIELNAENIMIAVLQSGNLQILMNDRFPFKIKCSDSYWCLEPGKHISVHLEKATERWWESLLDKEPRIELSKIECTRNLDEMGESEQMKVEELMWNQRRKLLGQPTSDQIRMEQMLRRAWDAKGSPFKGTEYDPSLLRFN